MLWDQGGLWTARGASEHTSPSVLKYKPRVVSVGTVTEPPYHTHHRADDDYDAPEFSGYRVTLRWWDPVRMRWHSLKPVISPTMETRTVTSLFPTERPGTGDP